jgi:hypothetical protein
LKPAKHTRKPTKHTKHTKGQALADFIRSAAG